MGRSILFMEEFRVLLGSLECFFKAMGSTYTSKIKPIMVFKVKKHHGMVYFVLGGVQGAVGVPRVLL